MSFSNIRFEKKGHVAVLTLNRPQNRNVITDGPMIEEVEQACDTVNREMDIKVLVITGADPAFSAGGNIKDMAAGKGMFSGGPAELVENYRRNVQRVTLAVYGVEVPTIAAVNGPAIGAGCDLALMCDMRVASEKAAFGETFLNIGIIPGDGGAYFLPRVVGMAAACELTFTGEIVDAKRALEIGLVNRLVPHDRLMAEAMELAGKIASKPAPALRMAKRLLRMGQEVSLQNLLEQSAAYQAICHHTPEHREALSAMLEKIKTGQKGK